MKVQIQDTKQQLTLPFKDLGNGTIFSLDLKSKYRIFIKTDSSKEYNPNAYGLEDCGTYYIQPQQLCYIFQQLEPLKIIPLTLSE
jgi:hypothetical protein